MPPCILVLLLNGRGKGLHGPKITLLNLDALQLIVNGNGSRVGDEIQVLQVFLGKGLIPKPIRDVNDPQ